MAAQKELYESVEHYLPEEVLERLPLWQLDVAELTGHNLESKGRKEVEPAAAGRLAIAAHLHAQV